MYKQRKHLRAVRLSPTRGEQENTMKRAHRNTQKQCREFRYGEVIWELALADDDDILSYQFYCLDADTAAAINRLAKTISFPVWQTQTEDVWFHSDSISVSRTPHGWFANRQDQPSDRQLTHRGYPLPILFPTAEVAQAAVELCLPNVHPALGRSTKTIEKLLAAKTSGLQPALGRID
jgi:hypothetical protein